MKSLNVYSFIVIIFIMSACTVNNKKDAFVAPSRELISSTIIDQNSSMLLGKLSSISGVINNAVYLFDPWGDYFYTKYDVAKNEAYRFCKKGQGPNEVVNVLSSISLVSKDNGNYISIFDNYHCKFLFFHEDRVEDNNYVQESSLLDRLMIADAFPINDSIVIARGVFGKNICMFLKNGREQSVCLESFTKVGNDNVKRILKDANEFALSPSKEYLIRITQNGGLIEGYKIKDMQLIQQFSHNYFEVICDENLSDTKDSRYGYIDVAVSNDKIYGLYDGGLVSRQNTYRSNIIHVYNMDGDIVEKLQLDQYVKSIGVDCENKRIFAKSANDDLLLFNLQ